MVKDSLPTDPAPRFRRYPRYDRMLWPRESGGGLLRALFGLAVVVIVAVLWSAGVLLVARQLAAFDLSRETAAAQTLALLLAVAGLGLGTVAAMLLAHRERAVRLIGPARRALRHFAAAAGTTLAVSGIIALATLPFAGPLEQNLPWSFWLILLPFTLLALVFQTGAEEVFFRGYLQSQLASRFASPLVWLLIPSLLFGLLHFAPFLPPTAAWTYVGAAAFYGLMAADLTARTDSLGAAWGFHFANNVIVVAVVAADANLGGLALYRSPIGLGEALSLSPWLLVDLLVLLIVWRLIRRALGV